MDDKCGIFVADYRDLLGSLEPGSADLVLTDPPYSISKQSGFSNGKLPKFTCYKTDFGLWDHEEIDLTELANLSYRALRAGGTIIVWYDLWKVTVLKEALEAASFRMLRLIEWAKSNPVPINSKRFYLSNSREVAVAAVKGRKPTFNGKYHTGRFDYPIPRHNGSRIHPTQKHDELFVKLVELHSNRGDLVVDPFVGGGTTAEAALSRGRRFMGGDLDPHYVQRSKLRLAKLSKNYVAA